MLCPFSFCSKISQLNPSTSVVSDFCVQWSFVMIVELAFERYVDPEAKETYTCVVEVASEKYVEMALDTFVEETLNMMHHVFLEV